MPGALWIHGGAEGFDAQVELYAQEAGIKTEILPPRYNDPEVPARVAPFRRNDVIIDRSDVVVTCYDQLRWSGGTFYVWNKIVKDQAPPCFLITPIFVGLKSYQINHYLAIMQREMRMRAGLDDIAASEPRYLGGDEGACYGCCEYIEGAQKCLLSITPSLADRAALRANWSAE